MKGKKRFIFPLFVLFFGAGWMLDTAKIFPSITWLWPVTLGVLGVCTLLLTKLSRLTLVLGTMFLLMAVCSVFRQAGHLEVRWEIPLLVTLFGLLMLIAQILPIPFSAKITSGK